MLIEFQKYQGTGNDFIILNNLDNKYNELSIPQIQFLCDRKFGIGADGLIKINKSLHADFEADYYNSDGSKSFCGNGGRCAVAFANKLGLVKENTKFEAIDGIHEAEIKNELVHLKMLDVNSINKIDNDFELNTGSPHYIKFVENALDVNVYYEGRKIRYSPPYSEVGINVNFVEILKENELEVATYERGVEDETLSCGTGITASAIAYALRVGLTGKNEIKIHAKGGKLHVKFDIIEDSNFSNVFLIGPAEFVFEGKILL